jgi:GNAT superfamily N-acetyltransferase
MKVDLRKAVPDDVGKIADLIAASVRGLAQGIYDDRQIELSIRSVFGVDTDLIADGTYFVAEVDRQLAGCGGWSRRSTLYGASSYTESRDPKMLDPGVDAAKIRAFFVHPDWARRGIGKAILETCETEARACGFKFAEMMSTLPGVPLYAACGYSGDERVQVNVGEGVSIECVKMRKRL